MATSKKTRDIFILIGAIAGLVIGVLGWHWTETANKPFWWNFWIVAAIVCDVAWIGFWVFFWNKDKPRRS